MYHFVPKETTAKTESPANSGRANPETCTNNKMCKRPVPAHSTKYLYSAAEQKSSCSVKHGDSKKPVVHSQPSRVVKQTEDQRSQKEKKSEERASLSSVAKSVSKQKEKSVCRPPGSVGMSHIQPSPTEPLRRRQQQQQQPSQPKLGTSSTSSSVPLPNDKAKAKANTVLGSGVKDYLFPFSMMEIESVEYYDGVSLVCCTIIAKMEGLHF